MKDSISRWSLHYEGWAAEHNISCLPRGNRSRGKGLSLLSPCRGGAPPFSPALPSYSVSLLFLLFAPAVTKPHSGRFSSAFRPFCSANPAAGSRNMHIMALQACTGGLEVTIAVCHAKIGDVLSFSHDKSLRFCHLLARLISALHRLRTITVYKNGGKSTWRRN